MSLSGPPCYGGRVMDGSMGGQRVSEPGKLGVGWGGGATSENQRSSEGEALNQGRWTVSKIG